MFDRELNSFLFKFHQLRKSGVTAHLDVDTHAGEAWVGLRVMLGPPQHQPAQRHRSPSYFRRQERRRAARQSSEESDKVVAEQVATVSTEENAVKVTESSEGNAVEATSDEKVAKELECEICDFKSNRATGLRIHMSRKHANIEQLDGNTSLLNSGYGWSDEVDDEIEHFLEKGYAKNPSITAPPYDKKLRQCISDEMWRCGLSWKEKQEEFKLMNIQGILH